MRMKNDGADPVKYAHKLIARAHAKGALAMTTIGTSQEARMRRQSVENATLTGGWQCRCFASISVHKQRIRVH